MTFSELKELIVFTVLNKCSFNSVFFLGKVFKRDIERSSNNGGCRTTASIEACGASEGGSIPPSCPIFSFDLFYLFVYHHW